MEVVIHTGHGPCGARVCSACLARFLKLTVFSQAKL